MNGGIIIFGEKLKYLYFKYKWKIKHKQNMTYPENIFNIELVSVGKNTYGELYVQSDDLESHLYIGNYCSIGGNVRFLLGIEHRTNTISTYPFKVKIMQHNAEAFSKGDIVIEDDVWIGYHATIMSGVHIGQGAVVAANAVVSKDVPPYAVVGGVPAKVIKYRFGKEIVEELLKVDYSKLNKEMIEQHIDELYAELKNVKQLEWLPKKEQV